MKTLLHTCCGPCASACVPRLKEKGDEVTLLFANSNIDTRVEFEKRLGEVRKLAAADGVPVEVVPYDHEDWLREVARGFECEPEKGARCVRCFRYNLRKAAEVAAAKGFESFTTSLTVSPHKVSKVIFEEGRKAEASAAGLEASVAGVEDGKFPHSPVFLCEDFKKREGFKLSVRRAKELGLYRQSYCGCEFSHSASSSCRSAWTIHHKPETASTNLDARAGVHGDVFTADYQSAGRGRLDHTWHSPRGANLMMSAVLSVEGLAPERVATFPLVAGLAVVQALTSLLSQHPSHSHRFSRLGVSPERSELRSRRYAGCDPTLLPLLKWPNDVLIGGRKVSGILCERVGDRIIVGIGINVANQAFPSELAARAISLGEIPEFSGTVLEVRDAVLRELWSQYGTWRDSGFETIYPKLQAIDFLKGREIKVRQTDDDAEPICGVCGGIRPNGSLDVGGVEVYAGEAHVFMDAVRLV